MDLHLSLRPTLEDIEVARRGLDAFLRACGLSDAAVYTAELVLEEVVSNIARHGQASRIELHAEKRGEAVLIVFEDDGPAFDPTGYKPALGATDAASAVRGGRGILLVRQFAQAVSYDRSGALNRLTVSVAT